MADEIIIETTTAEVIEVGVVGPQGASGQGVPVGGTTGQVLSKASGTNYDTQWVEQTGGGGDFSSPPPIGDVVPNTGAFTTISASGLATLPHIHGSLAGNLYIHVKNTSGGALSRGTPVYVVGNVGATDRVEVAAADFDDVNKMPAVGLLNQNLAHNGTGDAIIVGELASANTAAYALAQELFVGNAGTITGSRPTTGEIQSIGTVARVQSSTGVIVVNMQARRSPLAAVAISGDYDDLSDKPTIPTASTTTPAALGTAAVGVGTAFARADHVHAMPTAANVGADPIVEQIITSTANFTVAAARRTRLLVSTSGSVSIALNTTNPQNGDFVEVSVLRDGLGSQSTTITTGGFGTLVISAGQTASFVYDGVTGPPRWLIQQPGEFDAFRFRIAQTLGSANKVALNLDSVVGERIITVPNSSGTIALNETFAAPPAIGNTTRNTGAFTTLSAAPTSGSALTLTGGTVTASAPVLDASQTWNNGAVTFTGLAATITNTASATGSLVARLTVGSTNVFETDVRGFTTLRKVATTTDFVNVFTVRRGTTQVFAVRDDGVATVSGASILSCGNTEVTSQGLQNSFVSNLFWAGSASYILELYGSTNPHTFNIYGTRTSTTNYQRMTVKSVKQTLSALSGASATTTGTFIPDGAVVVGVTTRVSTALTGATGYQVGDGTDADRWGDINAFALNTTSDNVNWTAGTIECFTAGGEVTLTANGSNFTAGAIEICVFYLAGQAD